jgi:hypothetical protein
LHQKTVYLLKHRARFSNNKDEKFEFICPDFSADQSDYKIHTVAYNVKPRTPLV